jgi:hypothetical protein
MESTVINAMPPAPQREGDEVRTLRRVVWAMTVILGLSLAINLFLALQVNRLSKSTRSEPNSSPIQAGAVISPAKVQDLNGQPVLISYDKIQQPVVLYVFTPQCIWCSRNLANLQTLVSQKSGSYQFVGLSLTGDGLGEYLAKNKLDFPIYVAPAEETRQEYRLGSTPQMIVISPGGKVAQTWIGAYSGVHQSEVEKFFGVKLPGITPGP